MKIKNSSKDWAESRGAVLIGTPLKPINVECGIILGRWF